MWTASQYYDLISGRQRGWRPTALRAALQGLEGPYRCAMWCRNRWYDRFPAAVKRAPVPVVSVGNLTLGGTGKTPFVVWLAQWFRQRGVSLAIVSRGYGAERGGSNDEARELELLVPDVPHLQRADRLAAARMAATQVAAQLIVLDDGFQHRRLHRELDIVLLDATAHDGWGHVFPRGTLRESPAELVRADALVLTRSDQCSPQQRAAIRRWAQELAPAASWTEFVHRPDHLVRASGERLPLEHVQGKQVAAFCGIGNPASFRRTLEDCGVQLAAWREYPDHHHYTRADVDSLCRWAQAIPQADAVVCTRKDLVKIQADQLGTVPLMALGVAMQPVSEWTHLENQLAMILHEVRRGPPSYAGERA